MPPPDQPTGPYFRSFLTTLAVLVTAAALPACKTMETDAEAPVGIDQPTFALIDLDHDGRVSPSELALHKHQEGLAEFDLDNDRRISAAEWSAARPSSSGNDAQFRRLDRDGDGFVTEEEAVKFILEQTPFGEAFRKLDANGDGHLHWEEYAAGDPELLNVTLVAPGT